MSTSNDGGIPIINLPFLYINGLIVSNDATTEQTVIDLSAGQCRDSTNTYDMVLNAPITVSSAFNASTSLSDNLSDGRL